jgi:protein-S-isoprenylcysteine O-methyltransferase Ste14
MSEAAATAKQSDIRELKRERRSNWVGFSFFLIATVVLLLRSSTFGILLLLPVLHETISAFAFLLRRGAKARLRTLPARVAAYGGSFMIPVFAGIQGTWFPDWLTVNSHSSQRAFGAALCLLGTILSIAALWQLRYSFSIEPQARRFQGTGLYRLARHPIYLGYFLQYFGALTLAPTLPFAVVVLAWAVLCSLRMHYEEKVLRSTFPQYSAYSREVGMLWPRLGGRRTAKSRAAMPLPNGVMEVTGR